MAVEIFGQKSVKVWQSKASFKDSTPESENEFVAGTYSAMKRFVVF
jgi:hypothetical protein